MCLSPSPSLSLSDRLLQENYKFLNLNPYEVLQLTPEATDEEIKVRYRKVGCLLYTCLSDVPFLLL